MTELAIAFRDTHSAVITEQAHVKIRRTLKSVLESMVYKKRNRQRVAAGSVSVTTAILVDRLQRISTSSWSAEETARHCVEMPADSRNDAVPTPDSDIDTSDQGEPVDNTAKGMLLVAGSAICFSCMSLLVQCIARTGVPSCQIVFLNASIRCVVAIPQLCQLTMWPFTSTRTTGLILLRACGGFGGICCAFYAFSVLPLGDATVILFTAPVWTSLLAAAVLREKLRLTDGASILLSLAGVVLVAQPSADLSADGERLLACGVALIGAMSAAVAYCCVRKLGSGTSPVVLVSVFSVLSVALAPVLMAVVGQQWKSIREPRVWAYILAMGPCGYAGQILLNRGLQMGAAAKTTLARNLDIVISFVLQLAILRDPVDLWSVVGALLITTCTLLSFLKAYVDEKKQADAHKTEFELLEEAPEVPPQVKKDKVIDDSQAYKECSSQLDELQIEHSDIGDDEAETLVKTESLDGENNQL